jgi:hypothetical protein
MSHTKTTEMEMLLKETPNGAVKKLKFRCLGGNKRRKMLDLQHQYNNCTTTPHMKVGPTYWGPPSCEELLYSCCIGVVQESNPIKETR